MKMFPCTNYPLKTVNNMNNLKFMSFNFHVILLLYSKTERNTHSCHYLYLVLTIFYWSDLLENKFLCMWPLKCLQCDFCISFGRFWPTDRMFDTLDLSEKLTLFMLYVRLGTFKFLTRCSISLSAALHHLAWINTLFFFLVSLVANQALTNVLFAISKPNMSFDVRFIEKHEKLQKKKSHIHCG